VGPPGKRKRERRLPSLFLFPGGPTGERKGGEWVGGIGTPPYGTGREGKGMEGRMGWEGREGEGKEGEGEEISIHGLKLVAPPMSLRRVDRKTDERT